MALTTYDKATVTKLAKEAVAAVFAAGLHKGITFKYDATKGSLTATVAVPAAAATTFAAMTDRATVNLPTMNTMLANALKSKIPLFKPPRDQNTSATLAVADALTEYVNNSGVENVTYTIDGALAWPAFSMLELRQGSTGTVTVAIIGGKFSGYLGTRTVTSGIGDRLRFQCLDATVGANVWEWI